MLYKTNHKNVAQVQYACFDSIKNKIRLYMPYYSRGSLQDIIDKNNITLRNAIRIMRDICQGVDHIHRQQIIHADLKPTNILMHSAGYALVTDFGQSVFSGPSGTAVGQRMYKYIYPPEAILNNRAVSRQSDIYQLGLLLYRLVNGQEFWAEAIAPYNSGQRDLANDVVKGRFPSDRKYLPHVPRNVRRLISRASNPDPAARFATVEEFMNALSSVAGQIDWQYTKSSNGETWFRDTLTHKYTIELRTSQKGGYEVEGYTEKKGVQTKRKKSEWCRGAIRTKTGAYTFLQKILK